MLRFIFRILFVVLGLGIFGYFGFDAVAPLWYRVTGTVVEGRVIGFLAGKHSPSVQPEPTGVRKGRRLARRPVFRHPVALGAKDSLDTRSRTGGFLLFGHYDLHQSVTVVMPKGQPERAQILGFRLMFMGVIASLFGLFIAWMGWSGKG
ncbi:MAG: hypothetical protein R2795_05480 [Saprospiraceae bacterium]